MVSKQLHPTTTYLAYQLASMEAGLAWMKWEQNKVWLPLLSKQGQAQ